ncbi:MAG: hypothetical protein MZV70_35275 [Desulfobacterales bacterium]|nr:hypothetical protein [Desulfobacterales bacterium]
MVNENVSGNQIPITCQHCPQTKIVILEVAGAEALIHKPISSAICAPEQHAEADDPSGRVSGGIGFSRKTPEHKQSNRRAMNSPPQGPFEAR